MIKFHEDHLSNGLTLITHEDKSTPLVVVNVMYKVGSRNEQASRTGFAHLFEHLMFGGSKHVPHYDQVLQNVGAENNAFTNTDITNYYVILGAENIETALWAESDRMQYLNLDQRNLDNQKNVVIEEFKQRYLNVPYGDVWLNLRPLAYKTHPYQWATIGKEISHIEQATLKDVKNFHDNYYCPDNAIVTLSGNITHQKAMELTEKWFGSIPSNPSKNQIPHAEPKQTSSRFLEIESNVPMDAIYKSFHMPGRGAKEYIIADLLSDLLGRGKSSRLHQSLVKERNIFNNISAYVLGTADPGLLVVSGKVNPGINISDAENYMEDEINKMKQQLSNDDVEKVRNQAESSSYFSETELLNRTINLSIASSLGNTNLINDELEYLSEITREDLLQMSDDILVNSNCSTLFYKSKDNSQ